MALVDIIIALIIAAFVLFGFIFGFVHTLGSLVGSVVATIVTSRLIGPAMGAMSFFFGNNPVNNVILFIVMFLIISRLVGILFWIAEKFFGLFTWIPFAKTVNRLLGAVLGFVEGVLIVGVVLFFAMRYLPDNAVASWLEVSVIANVLLALMSALQVLFPEAVKSGP